MAQTSTSRGGRGAEGPPGGGSREAGWGIAVLIAAHLCQAIQSGVLRAPGVLYLSWQEYFGTSDSETAAVQSVYSSMSCFGVFLGGLLTDRFGCRIAGMLGGVLMALGLLGSYGVTELYQLYITIAISGLGTGSAYNSSVVIIAMYFTRRYKMAHAVSFSGEGTGMMSAPPILQSLSGSFGWRGTFLVASAVAANGVALSALFRPRGRATRRAPDSARAVHPPPTDGDELEAADPSAAAGEQIPGGSSRRGGDAAESEPLESPAKPGGSDNGCAALRLDTESSSPVPGLLRRLAVSLGLHLLVKSYRFALVCVIYVEFDIAFMGFTQYLVPRARGVGVAPSSAALLLSVFGAGSLLGRLTHGLLISWKVSAEHVTIIITVTAGVSVLLLTSESYHVLAAAAFLFGFTSGCVFAVMVVFIRQFVGLGNLAVGLGISQLFLGTGAVIGPILAGWILDLTSGSYHTVFYVCAAACFICAAELLLLPLLRRMEPGIEMSPADRHDNQGSR